MNMKIALITNWWALVLRVMAGIAFGILTFAWPGITLLSLVLLFGAYALVDGVVSLAGAIRAIGRHERWGVLVMEGITGILAAIITMVWPGITMVGLVFLVAAWSLVTGALETTSAAPGPGRVATPPDRHCFHAVRVAADDCADRRGAGHRNLDRRVRAGVWSAVSGAWVPSSVLEQACPGKSTSPGYRTLETCD